MANCLITKLKGIVNNPYLFKIGERIFDSTFQQRLDDDIVIRNSNPFTISSVNGSYYASLSPITQSDVKTGSYQVPSETNCFLKIPEGSQIKIDNLYTFNRFQGVNVNSELINITSSTIIDLLKDDISKILQEKANLLSYLVVDDKKNNIVQILAKFENVDNINIIDTSNLAFTMTEIGRNISLTCLNFMLPQNNLLATGSIEDLITQLRSRGKTSGSIRITGNLGENSFTFEGLPINGYTAHEITWDASSISMT